jgi:hypothetical protein
MRKRWFIGAAVGVVASLVGVVPAHAVQGERELFGIANEQTQWWQDSYGTGYSLSGNGFCTHSTRDPHVVFLPVMEPPGAGQNLSSSCPVSRKDKVLLDGFGAVLTEDNHVCSDFVGACYPVFDKRTRTLVDTPYRPSTLEAIGAQILKDLGPPGTATLDGRPLDIERLVTPVFTMRIYNIAPNYADSEALGHPGSLAGNYAGGKVLIEHLSPGIHTIVATSNWFAGTTITHTLIVS